MKQTAFVTHHDCARHDTGWGHPDHQGRIPAVAQAVYRDMLTLFDPLLEVEALPATEVDLLLAHSAEYIARVRAAAADAAAAGTVGQLGGVPISGASWDAATAAVGSGITAVDTVLRGEVRNAFCSVRPPGGGARRDEPGRFGLFNTVAVAARHLRERRGIERILVVSWGAFPPEGTEQILAPFPEISLLSFHQRHATSFADSAAPADGADGRLRVALEPGSDGEDLGRAQGAALAEIAEGAVPDFVLLAAGFDILAGDPQGGLAVTVEQVHELTEGIRRFADARCGGRLVSILEGGYAPAPTALAVVQHLRALAGLPPA